MKKITDSVQSCCSCVPARFFLVLLGGFAIISAYTMRNVLSIAITEMTYREARDHKPSNDTCPVTDIHQIEARDGYKWDEPMQGIILGAFYWGYVITHIPGALLSARYGGKYTLSLGILSTAILSLLTPFVIHHGGAHGLIALRVLEGFGEGTTFPALNTLLSAWIPKGERAKAAAFVYGGAQIGNILTHLCSGLLIDYYKTWAAPFYFFGICGIIWFCLFEVLCFKDPASHPYISEKEKNYLKKELSHLSRDKNIHSTPWLKIMTSAPMIALISAQIGHAFGYFTVVTDLPKYMADVLNFNIKENGLYSTLPYVAMWITSMLVGTFSDWCLSRNYIDITKSRKLYTTISFTLPGIFLVLASYSGCYQMHAVLLFTIAMGFMGAYYSGMKANNLDLSPNFAGAIMAITNGIGAIVGIINPYLIGVITEDKTLSEWRKVFFIACSFLVVTNIIYLIWGSAERQPWDDPEFNDQIVENGTSSDNSDAKVNVKK